MSMLIYTLISSANNSSQVNAVAPVMCRADEWVLKGISGYIYGLYLKKTFGVNAYRHWIKEVHMRDRTIVLIVNINPKKPSLVLAVDCPVFP